MLHSRYARCRLFQGDFEKWTGKLWTFLQSSDFTSLKEIQATRLSTLAPTQSVPPQERKKGKHLNFFSQSFLTASEVPLSLCSSLVSTEPDTTPVPSLRNPWSAMVTVNAIFAAIRFAIVFSSLQKIRELHTLQSPRSVKHIEFDITNSGIKYTTGSTILLWQV
jgi:sulfite reductase alpha subunit-like flavoprotein